MHVVSFKDRKQISQTKGTASTLSTTTTSITTPPRTTKQSHPSKYRNKKKHGDMNA
jgi:hypothetical protein